MQLKPGTRLQGGKYEIIKTLGQGGFGITYEADHLLFGQKVALMEFFMKDICNRSADTAQVSVPSVGSQELAAKFKEKFIKEARMMFKMNHPNIVRVLDVFEENDTAYYVMEDLPGGSLADKVKREGPLPEALAEKYIRQVASALNYIHSRNTVHLDVKPSNILLNLDGEAVLIDFGISKHYDKAAEQTSSTPVGYSPGYAPLEQMKAVDVKTFTPATDIYSLGATMYYLVTGTVPPDTPSLLEDGLARPEGLSDNVWSAIERAMQPVRKNRCQSIQEFLGLLDAKEEKVAEEVEEAVDTPADAQAAIPAEDEPKDEETVVEEEVAEAPKVVAAIYGLIFWKFFRSKSGNTLQIKHLPLKKYPFYITTFVVSYAIIVYILLTYTNSNVPYLDTFTTALSIVGLLLLARKYIEQWVAWVFVDAVCAGLYIYKGIYFTAGLYALYTVLAIYGYIEWKRQMEK